MVARMSKRVLGHATAASKNAGGESEAAASLGEARKSCSVGTVAATTTAARTGETTGAAATGEKWDEAVAGEGGSGGLACLPLESPTGRTGNREAPAPAPAVGGMGKPAAPAPAVGRIGNDAAPDPPTGWMVPAVA